MIIDTIPVITSNEEAQKVADAASEAISLHYKLSRAHLEWDAQKLVDWLKINGRGYKYLVYIAGQHDCTGLFIHCNLIHPPQVEGDNKDWYNVMFEILDPPEELVGEEYEKERIENKLGFCKNTWIDFAPYPETYAEDRTDIKIWRINY